MLAEQIQFSLEFLDLLGSGYEYLQNLGLRLGGSVSKHVRVYGDLPYVEKFQPGFLCLLAYDVQVRIGQSLVLWKEDQACAVFEPFRNGDSLQ